MNIGRRPRTAFTLIELLVVISIIAVIAGLLIPAVSMARDAARSIRCLSQLRQIGAAIQGYAADNDDLLVAYSSDNGGWFELLVPYAGARGTGQKDLRDHANVLHCPEYTVTKRPEWSAGYGMRWNHCTTTTPPYGKISLHYRYPGGPPKGILTMERVPNQSGQILAGDSVDKTLMTNACSMPGVPTFSHQGPHDGGVTCWGDGRFLTGAPRRHRGKANYLFYDSHVATMPHLDAALRAARPDIY